MGDYYRDIKGDTRSLDNGSYAFPSYEDLKRNPWR